MFCFFFSSRRRHTRWTGDWSSDVCSSDLARNPVPSARPARRYRRQARHPAQRRQILLGRRNAQENGRAVLALRDFGPCYLSQRGRPPTCSILPTGAAKRNLAIPLKRLEPATAQEPFGARAASARPALT